MAERSTTPEDNDQPLLSSETSDKGEEKKDTSLDYIKLTTDRELGSSLSNDSDEMIEIGESSSGMQNQIRGFGQRRLRGRTRRITRPPSKIKELKLAKENLLKDIKQLLEGNDSLRSLGDNLQQQIIALRRIAEESSWNPEDIKKKMEEQVN